MILNSLAEHYQDLSQLGRVAKPGWGTSKVAYALKISENGELLAIESQLQERPGQKKMFAPTMFVPMPVKRSSGVRANFLCDNAEYILGVSDDAVTEKTKLRFEAAKQLHTELLQGVSVPAAKAVVNFFQSFDPEKIKTHPALEKAGELDLKSGNIVFSFNGDFVHQDPVISKVWEDRYNQIGDHKKELCLVTGTQDTPTMLHPTIKGVAGAQSMGVSLVSFGKESFCSYGRSTKDQGLNAPVSDETSFAYGTALNYLLADHTHKQVIGDTTIVFWAKGAKQGLQDIYGAYLGAADTKIADKAVQAAMHKLSKGEKIQWNGEKLSGETMFYILGVSPNTARLTVRFFEKNRFSYFAKNLLNNQEQLRITSPSYDSRQDLNMWQLMQETANTNSKEQNIPSSLISEYIKSVLNGTNYPVQLMNTINMRIISDSDITRGRAALIKAYLLRNEEKNVMKGDLMESLNVNLKETSTAYLLGRAFSILEAIQEAANSNINATIKDRYISSATTTPALVFPTLLDLSDKHLNRLSKGQQIYFNKQLTNVMAEVAKRQPYFPQNLTLAEQGSFKLGYYLQTQERFTKKEDKKSE